MTITVRTGNPLQPGQQRMLVGTQDKDRAIIDAICGALATNYQALEQAAPNPQAMRELFRMLTINLPVGQVIRP